MVRRIMHVDMDAFYASVEQADNPNLRGKPVIVGASLRGVVSAASYEARKYGIHSALPVFQAKKLCPHGVFLPGRRARYQEVSRQIMSILQTFSPLVEQVSIDEAFVDLSGTEMLLGQPQKLAEAVKRGILQKTSLTCSIGIAPNKLLAKIASDLQKPDGLTLIEEKDIPGLLQRLPVHKIPGIGKKTAAMLRDLGVRSVADILKQPEVFWVRKLGKSGTHLYSRAKGIDPSPVEPHSPIKSCSAEDTFPKDTSDLNEVKKWLFVQAEAVGRDLRRKGLKGRTITLKIKFADFKVVTRSHTLARPSNCTQTLFETACRLLDELRPSRRLRLAGVGVSNLQSDLHQRELFIDPRTQRHERLDSAVDAIHEKYGKNSIRKGFVADFDP